MRTQSVHVARHSLLAALLVAVISPLAGAQTLPAPWQSEDVGAPTVSGGATHVQGMFTIAASGSDIWDTSDQFHFVYQTITGNVEIVARVGSITQAHEWSKAGVMVRESLAADSRHVMMAATADRGYVFQWRAEPARASASTGGPAEAPPWWVRLVRTGDLFQAYQSADGATWRSVGSETIPMGETVYVGLPVTSHSSSFATIASIDNVRVTATQQPNQPPAVSITAPAFGTQYTAPATVNIAASASDQEGRMLSVDFYVDSTLMSRDTSAPYAASWSTSVAGTYALTAVAHDADGGSTTSAATVAVIVPNDVPTVALTSPANGASFAPLATISLAATASDPGNQLARVEFYIGPTLLGSDTTAPYAFAWTSVPVGVFTLTAVAVDAAGNRTTSPPVSVTVGTPTSTPPRLVVFTASRDHATNVNSYQFDVFTSTANPATATPVATANLGKPTPDANNDITSDQSTLFSNLAAGNYIATVTAIGPGGTTRSATVSFTR